MVAGTRCHLTADLWLLTSARSRRRPGPAIDCGTVMEHYVILQRMAAERFAEAKAA